MLMARRSRSLQWDCCHWYLSAGVFSIRRKPFQTCTPSPISLSIVNITATGFIFSNRHISVLTDSLTLTWVTSTDIHICCFFSFIAPTIWNELPAVIGESNTLDSFKHRLKTHLTSNHPQHITTSAARRLPAPQIWLDPSTIVHALQILLLIDWLIDWHWQCHPLYYFQRFNYCQCFSDNGQDHLSLQMSRWKQVWLITGNLPWLFTVSSVSSIQTIKGLVQRFNNSITFRPRRWLKAGT